MKRIEKILSRFALRGVITLAIVLAPGLHTLSAQNGSKSGPVFTETAWITTDRQLYLPGEAIPFNAMVLESDTWRPSLLSRVLRVELLDPTGTRVASGEYLLEDSRTSGTLLVPTGTASGWYYLRAYTSWMRNRQDLLEAYLPLKIVSPAQTEPAGRSVVNGPPRITITPGNGSLQPGINRCAIYTSDAQGSPVSFDGTLLSTLGDTLAPLATDATGWGVTEFDHELSREYLAVSKSGGTFHVVPEIINKTSAGGTFSFSEEADRLTFSVAGAETGKIRVLVHRNYTWYLADSASVNNGRADLNLPTRMLNNGLYQFSALSAEGDILFTRLFMVGPATGEQPDLVIREAPEAAGNFTASYGNSRGGGDFLITRLVTRSCPLDIYDLYLPGIPGWMADYSIPAGRSAREGWMIANAYPPEITLSFYSGTNSTPARLTFNQLDLIDSREGEFRFMPETRGPVLSGSLTGSDGYPLQGLPVAATVLADNTMIGGFTHSSGRFHLPLPLKPGSHDLVLTATRQLPEGATMQIDQGFEPYASGLPVREFSLTQAERVFVRETGINQQLTSLYYSDTLNISNSNSSSTKRNFYGQPSYSILVDYYIKLTNIREVIYEVVPRVIVRSNRGKYSLQIISDPPLPAQYDPLFLLDGIPLTELDELLALPPDRIKRIDVIDRLYIHGNAIYAGIVSFTSVNGDLAGLTIPAGSEVVNVDIPEGPVDPFTRRVPGGENMPRLEPLLYWEPWTRESWGEFTFSNNDNNLEMVTIISGFNSSGQWIYTKKSISSGGKDR